MEDLMTIIPYLPFLIPLIIIDLVLRITALVHVLKHTTYRVGNRIVWILVVMLCQIIGPVIYFIFGRGDES